MPGSPSGTVICEADAPVVSGLTGDQLQDVPKWTGSAGAQYSFQVGDGVLMSDPVTRTVTVA